MTRNPPGPMLWEPDHPYYCSTGCYWKAGCHSQMSWEEFREEFGADSGLDIDQNLIWRWDWLQEEAEDCRPNGRPGRTLQVFMMQQRKAVRWSYDVEVRPDDEPEVRAMLEKHWEVLKAMWAPLSIAPEGS